MEEERGSVGERDFQKAPENWAGELLSYFSKEIAPKIEQQYSPELGQEKHALIAALGSKEEAEELPERSYERWFAEEIRALFELVVGEDLGNTEKLDLLSEVLFKKGYYANTGLSTLEASRLYRAEGEENKAELLEIARNNASQEWRKQEGVLSGADKPTHFTTTNARGSSTERYLPEE